MKGRKMKHWQEVLAYLQVEINGNRGSSTRLEIATRTQVYFRNIFDLIVRVVSVDQDIISSDPESAVHAYIRAGCQADTLVLTKTLVPLLLASEKNPLGSTCFCIVWRPGDPGEKTIIIYPKSLLPE